MVDALGTDPVRWKSWQLMRPQGHCACPKDLLQHCREGRAVPLSGVTSFLCKGQGTRIFCPRSPPLVLTQTWQCPHHWVPHIPTFTRASCATGAHPRRLRAGQSSGRFTSKASPRCSYPAPESVRRLVLGEALGELIPSAVT